MVFAKNHSANWLVFGTEGKTICVNDDFMQNNFNFCSRQAITIFQHTKDDFELVFTNKNYEIITSYGTKYSRMDQVNFLKAVFHKIYLVHS